MTRATASSSTPTTHSPCLSGYASVATDAGFSTTEPALARYTAEGALDPTFGTGGKYVALLPPQYDQDSVINAQTLLPNGEIVGVGGAAYLDDAGESANSYALLVRYGCQ